MILVCGDAMTDRYYFGDVRRISPEAPVPVVAVSRTEDREGGAANVANNVRALGVACETIFSSSKDKIVKIRVIAKNQQVCRVDFDVPQGPVDVSAFRDRLQDCSTVIFSDYGKGALGNVPELISIVKQAGKTVLVDPKGHDYSRYFGADVVKPNLDEMKELVGGWSSETQLVDKASDLRARCGLKAILLTRAAAGMTLFTCDGSFDIPSVAREVYDVSGAGDTAIAAFAVALTHGHDYLSAARYANKASGIVVGRFGTAVANKEEVFG